MATPSKYSRPMATEIQSDPIPSFRAISRLEAALLLVAFGVLWAALYWFAKGGPVSTDVLYYFQLGQLRIADPFVKKIFAQVVVTVWKLALFLL
jgi:membrane protein required for beta-lactamase induction